MSVANRIEIFTKPAAPMSKLLSDGVTVGGYSIQFLEEFMAPQQTRTPTHPYLYG